jgi:hypothetical protein
MAKVQFQTMKARQQNNVLIALALVILSEAFLFATVANAQNGRRRAANLAVDAPKAPFNMHSTNYNQWAFAWLRDIYAGGYKRAGLTNSNWDGPAVAALEAHAYQDVFHGPMPGKTPEFYKEQLKEAVAAGCRDSLIRYLQSRLEEPIDSSDQQAAKDYETEADDIEASEYPTLVKFYVNLRAYQASSAAQNPDNKYWQHAWVHSLRLLRHEELPATEAREILILMERIMHSSPSLRNSFYTNAEPALFARWPDEAFPYVFKAKCYIDSAWDARGTGLPETVTQENRTLFKDRRAIAEQALDKAWDVDPSAPETPLAYMNCLVGGRDRRAEMER